MTSESSVINSYPPELLSLICAHIYASGNSPSKPALDPILIVDGAAPTSLPSSYPSAYWPEPVVRKTLSSLCLVNSAWNAAAKPLLWRKVEVCLPHSWLSVVAEVAAGDHDGLDEAEAANIVNKTIQVAETSALATQNTFSVDNNESALLLHRRIIEQLSAPDGSIPPELLTPLVSRESSPTRLINKNPSPSRWKVLRTIGDAVRSVFEREILGLYVPAPNDPRPGRFIRHLDFNHFRTIGMRRSVNEGVNDRFVTGDRLESVLREIPNLLAFGATEYMDGALTYTVLEELLLRGPPARGRGRPCRGRDVVVDFNNPEEEDRERRRECQELEALDLTGCVSAVFVNALSEFVNAHLAVHPSARSTDSDDESSRSRSRKILDDESATLLGLKRLGLRGVNSVQPQILTSFVLAFPCLTHLDLSCTRVTPDLLVALSASQTVRLRSLSLARCNWLTGESIRNFLVDAPAAQGIEELSLYGDWTFPSSLTQDDLREMFMHAPCFTQGALTYLDISSAPITDTLLLDRCPPQPHLRSLGLSYVAHLSLHAISEFVRTKAAHVEVLTLIGTSPELGYDAQIVSPRHASVALHAQIVRPLCMPPFTFSLTAQAESKVAQPPTYLRVIELAAPLLTALGAGAESWRVVKSKGGRGWYVDAACGWVADVEQERGAMLRRNLSKDHPWRIALQRLAAANGNVSSGIGWHARKMEILHGHGMLGREAGLYGAVSFAYQG